MVFKLYSRPVVPVAGSVLVAMLAAEKNIPLEYIPIDMAGGEHRTPEYRKKFHPFGQVPVIDEEGFMLCETRAICRYLAEKYADEGTHLIPTGLKEKALYEEAASFEVTNFYPPALKIGVEAYGKPRFEGLPTDPAIVAEGLKELTAVLDVYEVILGKHKYLAGDEFTLVDLFHLYIAPVFAGIGMDVMTSKGPDSNVTRWWNDIISRPSWVKLQAEGIKSTAL
ncbi:glutathione S-transferase [Mycena vitilis]|nr:glutathione S-transferase [Mycena vitilis]